MFYRNKIKRIWSVAISAVLIFVFVSGCGQETLEEPEQKVLVEASTDIPQLAEATAGDIEDCDYYDGEINPYMQVLQFPRKGTFSEFRVALGDSVKAGQVIATTQPEYEEEIEELEEHIEELKTDYSNTVTSYDLELETNAWRAGQMREMIENMDSEMDGFDDICISFELILSEGEKIEVEKRQYIEKTEKEITFQEEKLSRLAEKNTSNVIAAPEDGIIAYLADLKVGDEVSVNSYPVVLADDTTCLVQCEYIPETEIEEMERFYAIKDGKQYELIYHPYEDGEFERKNAKEEGVYTFFEVEGADESIEFGEDIKVVMVKESRENVLRVPANCIHRDGENCFVYRYEDGKRKTVSVEIGISDGLHTEILSGIQKGDKIYVSN